MMLSVYFVTSLFALHIYGAKARLDVVFEDAYVDILDPQYFDPNNTVLFVEPNDEGINTLNSIITVVKLFDLEATAHGYLKALSMGRYNKATGIDVTLKFCDMCEEPVIMGPFLTVMGFNNTSCPPPLAVYQTEGYLLPDDLFPDTFGENKYLFGFEIFEEKNTIIAIKAFVEITEYDL